MYLELSSKSFRTGLALNFNSMLQWCTPLKGYSTRSVQQALVCTDCITCIEGA